MPNNLPIDFEERVKRPKGETSGDYPYAIKARDLMQNFVYAALDADASLVEETAGQGGHKQRRLKISGGTATGQLLYWSGDAWVTLDPPGGGLHVLASNGGEPFWIETEDCEE